MCIDFCENGWKLQNDHYGTKADHNKRRSLTIHWINDNVVYKTACGIYQQQNTNKIREKRQRRIRTGRLTKCRVSNLFFSSLFILIFLRAAATPVFEYELTSEQAYKY